MIRFLSCLALFVAFISGPASAAENPVAHSAITKFIVPGYERFAQDARAEAEAMEALCAQPGADRLADARAGFRALVRSWSRIEIVRFGPVAAENRMERILFWPDRRSIGLKQVQGAIATKDETATRVDRLQEKSVALQGLGALEYLLFGTGSKDLASGADAYRCAFGRAVAGALAETGGELVRAWRAPQGIASRMTDPRPAHADYRTREEVMQELLGVWVHGMDMVRDTRIAPFLGETPEDGNHKRALFWRSGMTVPALAANAQGFAALFDLSGLDERLADMDSLSGDSFTFELTNFSRTAAEIDMPVAEAVADPAARADLEYLLILTGSLQDIAMRRIGVDLGLVVGFSSLDGD